MKKPNYRVYGAILNSIGFGLLLYVVAYVTLFGFYLWKFGVFATIILFGGVVAAPSYFLYLLHGTSLDGSLIRYYRNRPLRVVWATLCFVVLALGFYFLHAV